MECMGRVYGDVRDGHANANIFHNDGCRRHGHAVLQRDDGLYGGVDAYTDV